MVQCCFAIAEIENCLLFVSREKPAHTPDSPKVHTLSSELKWTNEIHFYCFLLKPIRDGLAPGSPQSSSLPGRHAPKSSGSRLFRCLFATISPLVWKKASTIFRKLYLNFNVSFNSLGFCYVIVSKCPFVRCSRRRKHFLPQTNSV